MRTVLALTIAAALAGGSLAQPGQPAPQPAAQPAQPTAQPPKPGQQPPTTPPQPGQPAGSYQVPQVQPIPVPDGPIIKTTELEGGLIVEDIKLGDGYELKTGGAVVVHYHGTLKADPTKVFDSSFTRGEPMAYPLSGFVEGWQKGLPGLKVGGVRKLTVPSKMGYGERGNGNDIPPNSDLVFIIQLVDALQVEELKAGEGEAATGQFIAVTTQVVTDKDGKEIEKADPAHPYIWLPGEMAIPGTQFDVVQQGLSGMKVGGKRRIVIPKEMNLPNPSLPSTRPTNVSLTLDVDLIAVRNLPQRGGRR